MGYTVCTAPKHIHYDWGKTEVKYKRPKSVFIERRKDVVY